MNLRGAREKLRSAEKNFPSRKKKLRTAQIFSRTAEIVWYRFMLYDGTDSPILSKKKSTIRELSISAPVGCLFSLYEPRRFQPKPLNFTERVTTGISKNRTLTSKYMLQIQYTESLSVGMVAYINKSEFHSGVRFHKFVNFYGFAVSRTEIFYVICCISLGKHLCIIGDNSSWLYYCPPSFTFIEYYFQ